LDIVAKPLDGLFFRYWKRNEIDYFFAEGSTVEVVSAGTVSLSAWFFPSVNLRPK
jgi:hypothetical protein